jgi:hypothetical protein
MVAVMLLKPPMTAPLMARRRPYKSPVVHCALLALVASRGDASVNQGKKEGETNNHVGGGLVGETSVVSNLDLSYVALES